MRFLSPLQFVEWQSEWSSFGGQLHYAMRRASGELGEAPKPTEAEEAALMAALLAPEEEV